MSVRTFKWLHLSDLHVGQGAQGWMWPSVKNALFNDLRVLIAKTGPVDLIIFSGDLTQQGKPDEFARLDSILGEIREVLSETGASPPIIPVPGNHDLVRPKAASPIILLKRWWDEPEARERFWEKNSDLFRAVQKPFDSYKRWLTKHLANQEGLQIDGGLLPGDIGCSLNVGGVSVGVIGLNSAWLQLSAGDYERKLHVDPRQFLALTKSDPAKWRESHDVTLLVTHHPTSWLHPKSLEQWQSEIDPPGRFDAHLFGHMHVPNALTIAHGGSEPRTALQAASVFGLEYYGNSQTRIHGYSAGRLEISETSRTQTIWPRILQRHNSGKLRFIPDQSFELNEDNTFIQTYAVRKTLSGTSPAEDLPTELSPAEASESELLQAVRYRLAPANPHSFVRLPEQGTCIAALNETRIVRIQAEWGLGGDGFVWSVLRRSGNDESPVYRFDFSEFSTREEFLDGVKRATGFTFEKLCALIARQAATFIIFDNVDGRPGSTGDMSREAGQIAGVVLDYCPEAAIFMRSRGSPSGGEPPIRLRPLDEADTSTYVLHAPLGGKQLSRPENAAKLHRITDGAPGRLDTALKNLQVVSLDDLVAQNSDYEPPTEETTGAPESLVRTIEELKGSDDPHIKRSYELLKTLTAFPQGEQLDAIKRFNNSFPFFPPHATELLDRGLIDALPITEVAPADPGTEVRVLTVSRSIRDFIRAGMTVEEQKSLDERALEVYFGDDWKSGEFSSSGRKFNEPLQHGYKISNANALVMRLLLRAETQDGPDITTTFRVISAYFAALARGDHYRSLAALSDELAPHLDDESHARETTIIKAQAAKAIRMTGQTERARDILESIDLSLLTRELRRGALLNLALSYKKLDDPRAIPIAESIIKLGKTEPAALHAQAIIYGMTESGDVLFAKLRELEEQAKRREYPTLANTIALERSESEELTDDELDALLRDVLARAREAKDFYNGVRAIVKISNVMIKRGEKLSEIQKSRLISAYHFLFNERLSAMFDRCHSALWAEFERGADVENLLRLFRHSSLMWRLRDENDREQQYIKRLAGKVKPNSNAAALLPRETGYFLARTTSALIDKSAKAVRKAISSRKK